MRLSTQRLSTHTYGEACRPQDLALHEHLLIAAVHVGGEDLRVGPVVGHEHPPAERIHHDVLRVVQVELQHRLEPRVEVDEVDGGRGAVDVVLGCNSIDFLNFNCKSGQVLGNVWVQLQLRSLDMSRS